MSLVISAFKRQICKRWNKQTNDLLWSLRIVVRGKRYFEFQIKIDIQK